MFTCLKLGLWTPFLFMTLIRQFISDYIFIIVFQILFRVLFHVYLSLHRYLYHVIISEVILWSCRPDFNIPVCNVPKSPKIQSPPEAYWSPCLQVDYLQTIQTLFNDLFVIFSQLLQLAIYPVSVKTGPVITHSGDYHFSLPETIQIVM